MCAIGAFVLAALLTIGAPILHHVLNLLRGQVTRNEWYVYLPLPLFALSMIGFVSVFGSSKYRYLWALLSSVLATVALSVIGFIVATFIGFVLARMGTPGYDLM